MATTGTRARGAVRELWDGLIIDADLHINGCWLAQARPLPEHPVAGVHAGSGASPRPPTSIAFGGSCRWG